MGYDPDYDDDGREGCCFPNECLMPGWHTTSECHTIEMMEAQVWEDTEEAPIDERAGASDATGV